VSERFSEAEIVEVWERREARELNRLIGRRLGRSGASIRGLIYAAGGVRPGVRVRASGHLSVGEREEISCWIQLNRETPARTVRATPPQSCHPAGYGRAD